MSGGGGSYAFGTFQENEEELRRLKKQARIALPFDRKFWALAGLKPGMRAIDLACGPGVVTMAMSDAVRNGTVLGIDLSASLLLEAQRLLDEEGKHNVEFRQGDVYELPAENSSADFVYARLLFQHLDQPVRALKEVARALAPGGICCIVDVDDGWSAISPHEDAYATFLHRVQEGQASKGGDRLVGRKLGRYMSEAGFESIRTEIDVIHSGMPGWDLPTFLNLTTKFKQEHLPDSERKEGLSEFDTILGIANLPYGWAAAGIFIAIGEMAQ